MAFRGCTANTTFLLFESGHQQGPVLTVKMTTRAMYSCNVWRVHSSWVRDCIRDEAIQQRRLHVGKPVVWSRVQPSVDMVDGPKPVFRCDVSAGWQDKEEPGYHAPNAVHCKENHLFPPLGSWARNMILVRESGHLLAPATRAKQRGHE